MLDSSGRPFGGAGSRSAEHAPGEGLVADEGVDDAAAQRAEDARRLRPARRHADDVGDLEQPVEADAEDPIVDRAADGCALRVVLARRDIADGSGRPEGLVLGGIEIEGVEDRS
jgi:hypothetical protein